MNAIGVFKFSELLKKRNSASELNDLAAK